MKARIPGILIALALVLGLILGLTLTATANGGDTWYVDASTPADGTAEYYHSQVLVATTEVFAGYDVGDYVEFMPGSTTTWYASIQTKNSDYEVVLDRDGGDVDFGGTFNLVDTDAPSSGDPFFYIGAAIEAASSGDTVSVEIGTYYENIDLKDGVDVLGAGAGVSTIDGGSSGPVVYANGVGATTTFSGFTIQNGSAEAGGGMLNTDSSLTISNCTFTGNQVTGEYGGYGGGMRNNSSDVTLNNCTFSNNTATCATSYNGCGGGIYNNQSSPTLTDCIFSGNQATSTGTGDGYGGGIYNYICSPTFNTCTFENNYAVGGTGGGGYGGGMINYQSSPTLNTCTFSSNQATSGTGDGYGGGVFNNQSSPTLNTCTLSGNEAEDNGGGMYNNASSPNLYNCTLSGNEADYGSGMYNFNSSSPTLINCTLYNNTANTEGDGIYNENSSPTITNCILWDGGDEIVNSGTSAPTVTYCDVQGGYAGTGNINSDPLFADADFHLQSGSPCIDVGSNAAANDAGIATDFEGDTRIQDGIGDTVVTVDMGVDEYVLPTPTEVWVDDDWDGEPDGTEVETGKFIGYNAFATIQAGIDAVTGSTVNVAAGTYNERIELEDGVEVLGAGAGDDPLVHSIIDGGSSGPVVAASSVGSTTVLDGFKITGGSGSEGAGMYNVYASPTVRNCIFTGNTVSGDNGRGGGMANADSSPTVINCIFYNNQATGTHGQGGGMYNSGSSTPEFTPTLINCTFYNNSASEYGDGMYNINFVTPTLTNCILWDGGTDEIYNTAGVTPVVTYCDIEQTSGVYTGEGNINEDPSFIDADNGDFHLQANSPCINAGDDDAVAGISTDFEGDDRIIGNHVDIGADELESPTEVWVDDDYCDGCANDGHTWGYNAFDSIQDGIDAVTGSTVNVAAGTYYETIELRDGVDVLGAGAGDDPLLHSIIDGGSSGPVVTANSIGAATTFSGFTVQNGGGGSDGAGMYNNNSSLTVSDCTFTGNTTTDDGGGMYNKDCSPTLNNCTFSGNTAGDNGGGMFNESSSPELTGCTFTGNTATDDGGGIYNEDCSPTLNNCTFTGNTAPTAGSGMYNTNSSPTLSNCTFTGNTATYEGGGMYNYGSSPTLNNCTFSGNQADWHGGGMENYNGSAPTLDSCTFSDNTASYGGGMCNENSSPTLNNCTFSGNEADGGGIYNYSSSPTLTDCTFSGNTNAEYGGGVYNNNNSAPTLTGCTFTSNEADDGGGMYNDLSSPTLNNCNFETNHADSGGGMSNSCSSPSLTDCTFTGNTVTGSGGGMENYLDSDPTLTDCTFTANEADYGGGGVDNYHCSPTLNNCTFEANTTVGFGGGMNNEDSSPELTGCTFTDNEADYGGGIHNVDGSSAVISNCTFETNTVTSEGGGVFINWASPTLTDCTFTGNHSDWYGGGMHIRYHSSPTVTGCTFDTNTADYGAGICSTDDGGSVRSEPVITDCIFVTNAAGYGGGMANWYYVEPKVTNCIFAGNTATANGGGMMNTNWSSATVTNCTFYNNSADTHGDGMHNDWNATPTVTNCILWDGGTDEIYTDNGAVPVFTYCDIQGGYDDPSDHNINANPLFIDALSGDFHIQGNSPCIDAGNNAAPSLPSNDFEGESRIIDGDGDGTATVDMGVDESLAYVWVDDDWEGLDPGDPADGHTFGTDAFDTVQDGVDAVDIGGTVGVYDGKYTENVTITDKSLTVESISGDWSDTTIDLPAYVFGLLGTGGGAFDGDVTISGFTLTGSEYGVYITDGLASGSSVSINNCLIYDNDNSGIYADGILEGDIFIDDCVIGENGPDDGIHLVTVAGIVEITDSVIGAYWDGTTICVGNASDGIHIDSIYGTGSVLIDNNKIVKNIGNGIADGINGCYGHLTISDNVIGAYDYDLTSGNGYFAGNNSNGIYVDYVATTGVVTIEGNQIAQNDSGISFSGGNVEGAVTIDNNYIGAWTDYTTVSDTLYTRSFTGNTEWGIAVDYVTADGELTIINNKIAENSTGPDNDEGIQIVSISGLVYILANHVGAWTQDIPGGDPESYQGNGGPGIFISNVLDGSLLIQANTIDGNTSTTSGIDIETTADTAAVSINLNDILDNTGDGVYYFHGGADPIDNLDAENNWWGDASGPGGEGPGTGDEVSTHVDYDPWLEVSLEGAKAGTITDGTLDNIEGANTEVIVTGSAIVTSTGYSGNPGGSFSGDTGNYIDVFIDDGAGATEIEIRLYYTDDDIEGLTETSLVMRWWDGTEWLVCSDSGVNTTDDPPYSGYIWAKIRIDTTPNLADLVGSVFGGSGESLLIHIPPSDTTAPRISKVSTCYEGVTETTADICWTTNEKSTSQVKYWVSSSLLSPIDRTLVTEHYVQLTGLTPGTTYYYQTKSRDSSGNTATSDVYTFTTLGGEEPAAVFASSDLSISPSEVAIGETVTISLSVSNTGNLAGSYELTLEINSVAEETKEVTLEANTSQSISFTVSREEAGSYSVAVGGLSGSFTVTAPEATAQGGEVAEATEDEGTTNWPLIGGIIAAVVILLIIVIVVRRRAY